MSDDRAAALRGEGREDAGIVGEVRKALATTTLPEKLHVARIAETFQGAPMLVGYRVTFLAEGDPCSCFACMGTIDNAHLIAQAPTWLASLCDALDATVLRAERLSELRKVAQEFVEVVGAMPGHPLGPNTKQRFVDSFAAALAALDGDDG